MARRNTRLNWFDKLFLGFLGVVVAVAIVGGLVGAIISETKEIAAQEFHAKFQSVVEPYFTDGTKVTGEKAVCLEAQEYHEEEAVYTAEHVPESYLAEEPEEVRYVIRYISGSDMVGTYSGGGVATRKWAQVSVVDLKTGEIIGETKIQGGEPPLSIRVKPGEVRGASGSAPSEKEVLEWVLNTLEGTPVVEAPVVETSAAEETHAEQTAPAESAAPEAAGNSEAVQTARELLGYLHLGPVSLKNWLMEYEGYPEADAAYAVEHCGADWQEQALLSAISMLDGEYPCGPKDLKRSLMDFDGFTAEQADYALKNCGADWDTEALDAAKYFLESKMGYSYSGMVLVLVGDYGFTEEQAEYAASNCDADWNQVAVDHVELFLEYSEETYTREQMIQEMVDYYGFTEEQAIYAVDTVGLK